MRQHWGKLMASVAIVISASAWAQQAEPGPIPAPATDSNLPAPVSAPPFPVAETLVVTIPDQIETTVIPMPVALGVLGAALVLPLALALVIWQRWRIGKLQTRHQAAETTATRLRECLGTTPEGFFCWLDDDPETVLCSRRLAVLLSLPRGMDSTFEEVLDAFQPDDADALRHAVAALRTDGDSFDMELVLILGNRRVRATGLRAVTPAGDRMAELLWLQDVTEGASMVEDLAQSLRALVKDTAYLRALIDALPMPIWLRDEDLSLLTVNRAYAAAVDEPSTELVVADQVELASDNMVREARALAARARAAGEPRAENFHLVLGGKRWLADLCEMPLSVDDTLLTAGFALDQTRVEELQAELDRHVAAHGEVLERLSTPIAIFSTDTRLTFFNSAFVKLWRLGRDWLLGQPTYGQVLDALRESRMLPEVTDYRASKDEELKRFVSLIDPVETLMHLPDGRTLRRVVSPHPYGGLIYTYEDVTDTLAMERSFNTALAVQRETLDHLYEGIAVFGDDGRLKLTNPAFGRIWHLSAEDLAGGPHLHEVVERVKPFFEGRPDRASSWSMAKERLLDMVNQHRAEVCRLERQDGSIIDGVAVPLPDGAILVTWLDVTDTARVERALRERNEALAAADLLKSEFIANVSAEVSKPLTTVIGFAEMLTAEYFGKLNSRQHDYVKGVSDAGHALEHLVADILDLASIEAGQMTLELDAVDIHPLLAGVLALVGERVREKKLHLDFQCPLDIGWVVADQRRLKQILFNLIGNAVKFTPPGGVIVVAAVRLGMELQLSVGDSGPGIPVDQRAHVFDSFVRAGANSGPGLGLALVRRFVELHGGQVELKTPPEGGTIVVVRLPTGGRG